MDDPTVKKLFRAADQRFTAAEWLQRRGFNVDAGYLAGYTVECALKALILRNTPAARRDAVLKEDFRGRRGHNFELLKQMLRTRNCHLPARLAADFRRVATWSTDIRYAVGHVSTEQIGLFLAAVKNIRDWAKES